MHNINDISLALSGGGVRAMAFHCGVLRYLAEQKKLEHVTHISSVSGGSLLVGLIFSLNSMSWPSSDTYLVKIEPKIKELLTTKDLQNAAILNLLYPINWPFIFSRANILSKTIRKTWGVNAKVINLPKNPIWSVNGTTAETGKRFRFKHDTCGDYFIGYKENSEFSLADIMAISAAFPGGIGPFVINNTNFKRRKSANSYDLPPLPNFKKIHIYDGGIYDNLGMEAYFDIGTQELKNNCKFLIVSDAGLKLDYIKIKNFLNPFRLKRIADIALDQNRALRVRAFANFLKKTKNLGFYIQIGANANEKIEKNKDIDDNFILPKEYLNKESCIKVANYPTNLKLLMKHDFDLISLNGYETFDMNYKLFHAKLE